EELLRVVVADIRRARLDTSGKTLGIPARQRERRLAKIDDRHAGLRLAGAEGIQDDGEHGVVRGARNEHAGRWRIHAGEGLAVEPGLVARRGDEAEQPQVLPEAVVPGAAAALLF